MSLLPPDDSQFYSAPPLPLADFALLIEALARIPRLVCSGGWSGVRRDLLLLSLLLLHHIVAVALLAVALLAVALLAVALLAVALLAAALLAAALLAAAIVGGALVGGALVAALLRPRRRLGGQGDGARRAGAVRLPRIKGQRARSAGRCRPRPSAHLELARRRVARVVVQALAQRHHTHCIERRVRRSLQADARGEREQACRAGANARGALDARRVAGTNEGGVEQHRLLLLSRC